MRARISVIALSLFFFWSSPAHAWMWEVGDEELSEVTGEGFSGFTTTGNVMRATFDITVETNMDIDDLRMGYYNNGTTTGWDQDWGNVHIGGLSAYAVYGYGTNVTCNGLFIEAGFSNLSDPENRSLDYIKVGTPSMKGPIRANFRRFSGQIGGAVNGTRLNMGTWTVLSRGGEFSVTLSRTSGWRVYWENAMRLL